MTLQIEDEVYAYFGAAAMGAQLFEQNILLLLELRGHRKDYERALKLSQPIARKKQAKLDRLTLGRLVGLLKGQFHFPDEVARQFAEALDARNRLMHGYFPRNAVQLQSLKGKAEITLELDALKEQFFEASQTITRYVVVEGEGLISSLKLRKPSNDDSK